MDDIGPKTLERMRAIRRKVESAGRAMGIPEDRALKYVEIDTQQRLTESINSLHADEERWHKAMATWRDILSKGISYIAGLLKAEK